MVLLIDFGDSFTYNIVSELAKVNVICKVTSYESINEIACENMDYSAVLLGPGPGHPDDYSNFFFSIRQIIKRKKVVGICLGHQLFWSLRGAKVGQANTLKHGQPVRLKDCQELFEGNPLVQRYNSLMVKDDCKLIKSCLKVKDEDEILQVTKGKDFLTYQFHPESVGTSYRSSFFNIIKDFIV